MITMQETGICKRFIVNIPQIALSISPILLVIFWRASWDSPSFCSADVSRVFQESSWSSSTFFISTFSFVAVERAASRSLIFFSNPALVVVISSLSWVISSVAWDVFCWKIMSKISQLLLRTWGLSCKARNDKNDAQVLVPDCRRHATRHLGATKCRFFLQSSSFSKDKCFQSQIAVDRQPDT